MTRIGETSDLLKCSFCGKTQKQVKKLIAGPGVYICDECIELCNEIIVEELSEASSLGLAELPKPQEMDLIAQEWFESEWKTPGSVLHETSWTCTTSTTTISWILTKTHKLGCSHLHRQPLKWRCASIFAEKIVRPFRSSTLIKLHQLTSDSRGWLWRWKASCMCKPFNGITFEKTVTATFHMGGKLASTNHIEKSLTILILLWHSQTTTAVSRLTFHFIVGTNMGETEITK